MKKIIIRTLFFFLIIGFLDFLLGYCLIYCRKHAGCGSFQNMEYCINHSDDDVLVFGSSRAMYHYDPQIIKDSLGLSCYNCGREGMGILYSYGMWSMMSARHHPKIILYDFYRFDIQKEDYANCLAELRPYYDRKEMPPYFHELSPVENIKNISHLYRFNSNIIQLIRGLFVKKKMSNGFVPLHGEMVYNIVRTEQMETDSVKYFYMEEFIKLAISKGTTLVFFISPFYDGEYMTYPPEYLALFKKYNIKYFDNQSVKELTKNDGCFKNISHLNQKGASIYTSYIIAQIRDAIDYSFGAHE